MILVCVILGIFAFGFGLGTLWEQHLRSVEHDDWERRLRQREAERLIRGE